MDVKFENRCEYSRENLLEMMRTTRGSTLIAMVWIGVCVVILMVCSILTGDGRGLWYAGFFALLLLVESLIPRYVVNKTLKQYRELYHGSVFTVTTFTDGGMTVRNEQSGGTSELVYDQIRHIRETDRLFIIRMRHQVVVLIDRNGFTVGDGSHFRDFIRSAAPNARCRMKSAA